MQSYLLHHEALFVLDEANIFVTIQRMVIVLFCLPLQLYSVTIRCGFLMKDEKSVLLILAYRVN